MRRAALLIGLLTGAVFLIAAGNRLLFTNDEGVYLDGAVRVLRGEAPYRDFFSVAGPGTFWLLAALFRIFGVTLESARLLRALDLAAITGLTFWIAACLGRRSTAACAALLVAALVLGGPNGLVVNHRWEGSAFALAAVAAGVRLMERTRWPAAAAAGAFAIAGAWCTQSLGLVAVAMGAWFCGHPKLRRAVPAFTGGALAAALVPAAVLAGQGALAPMLRSMAWNSAHYALANRIAYGAMLDSPAGLLAAGSGAQRAATALFLFATLLPAILPPLVALAWLPSLRSAWGAEVFLLLAGAAFVGSAYPRWDITHLLYVVPVFVVLAAVWMERHVRGLPALAAAAVALMPATVMAAYNLVNQGTPEAVDTPVGRLRASPADARHLRMCLARVRPGDTLFVFPHQSLFYFLTAGRNPTRYSFLQPGMMTREDDLAAAGQLRANPPAWVLYGALPPQYYLRIWPSSNPADLRMAAIEDFIHDHYVPWPGPENEAVEYRLLQRQPGMPAP